MPITARHARRHAERSPTPVIGGVGDRFDEQFGDGHLGEDRLVEAGPRSPTPSRRGGRSAGRSPAGRPASPSAGSRSWNATCSSVMPVVSPALVSGTKIDGAPVVAALGDEHLAFGGDTVLRAAQLGCCARPGSAGRGRCRRDRRSRSIVRRCRSACSPSPRPRPGRGRRAPSSCGTSTTSRPAPAASTACTSGRSMIALVAAGDADRDRLGLVLDRVDRAGSSSSIALVSAATRSSISASGVPTLPVASPGTARPAGRTACRAAARSGGWRCSPRGGRRRVPLRRPSWNRSAGVRS